MWELSNEEVEQIEKNALRGVVKIDLDAAVSNMDSMHENLLPGTRMIAVIKTDGYGHGAVPIARVLEDKYYLFGYAVATAEEAFELRDAGLKKPILILGYTFPYAYERMILEDIRPAMFREDELEAFAAAARRVHKRARVHIKVDTGMGRIGIRPDDSGIAFVRRVLDTEGIFIEGIFTHFARADETDKIFADRQYSQFDSFIKRIKDECGYIVPIRHCSNSAAIIEMWDKNMDLVRAGITLYGLMPSEEVILGDVRLKPMMRIESRISFIKKVLPGESISYGGTFTADREMTVATVPLGYGDGYPRMLTGKGDVLVAGKRVPILGRICMDQFMIDISTLPEVRMGDKVVLLGKDGDEEITAEEIGAKSGRFNYEFVCLISRRIPRIYYLDGHPVWYK